MLKVIEPTKFHLPIALFTSTRPCRSVGISCFVALLASLPNLLQPTRFPSCHPFSTAPIVVGQIAQQDGPVERGSAGQRDGGCTHLQSRQ